ncbi:unnamed protein product [Adineta steineri]|uniref:Uncharacterized protein n=2 Tax=Adineta steineri TaxID=433720 RepID=A0A819PC22_9BILA|nr:unnamed protein product [Adineta steineri]CAF1476257.1 unnamed protein product [Adineta steineri]CAF3581091.1 unnamed protein product [Adineta steineri]CAF4011183.1 unnamed protein product [Adineta steineri]CAF4074697.1 unnamed protein product [Adineta steineri]
MTNLTSSNTYVIYLSLVVKQLTLSLIIPLILGVVGNLSSCIVFRQKQFRSNGMSLLFTAASFFNIIVLVYGIGTSLYTLDHISPDTYSIVFCKIRLYVRHIFLMIVRSYIILACVAAFALSSSKTTLRSLCQPRYVKWAIVGVPFVWPLIALHMPLLTIIENNQCVNIDSYIFPFAIYFFLIVGVIPVFLMTLFIFLTIRNLRLLHNRIQSSIATPVKFKSRDRQFIRMLSALVLMYISTNLFYPTNVLYSAITHWTNKSSERIAIESIISSVTTAAGLKELYKSHTFVFHHCQVKSIDVKIIKSGYYPQWNITVFNENQTKDDNLIALHRSFLKSQAWNRANQYKVKKN